MALRPGQAHVVPGLWSGVFMGRRDNLEEFLQRIVTGNVGTRVEMGNNWGMWNWKIQGNSRKKCSSPAQKCIGVFIFD